MPRTKSAIRAARVSEKREARNRSVKTASKSAIIKAEKAIAGSDPEAAKKEVRSAESSIDRAMKKNVIHPNTAARRKSRLAKKLAKSTGATTKKES